MNERTHDRVFAGCGIAFVVLDLVGAIIAMTAGKTHGLTISSTSADVAHAIAKPAGTAVWIGSYLEVLSVGAFLAFAVWACARLGGGLLGATARTAATGYAAVTIASLGVMAAIAYRAGHGMGVQLATALVTLNEALYVCTWFLSAFFLVAAGALALTQMRRALGWSAIGVNAHANRRRCRRGQRRPVHRDALVRVDRLREHRDRPRQARTCEGRRGRAERVTQGEPNGSGSDHAVGSAVARFRISSTTAVFASA